MLNVAFALVLPGERWQRAPCVEGMGKWAHEKLSLLVATRMASNATTYSTQGHTTLWENRSFVGQGGEARDRPKGSLVFGC
jgi:hypothetical protein